MFRMCYNGSAAKVLVQMNAADTVTGHVFDVRLWLLHVQGSLVSFGRRCSGRCERPLSVCHVLRITPLTSISSKKKLVGHRWGAPNSNYLLVMVHTFVMQFSITLNARVTPGCTTRRYRHECIRVLDTNQDSCAYTSTHIGKLAIAWESALSVWMLCTGTSFAISQLAL